MNKQNYIPEYTDIHTAKSAYEAVRHWGIWTCFLIIYQSFDSLPENKLERVLGNLNSYFIKRTRGKNKVSFDIREKFPVLFHDLTSKCCRHIPPWYPASLASNVLDLLLILRKQLFLYALLKPLTSSFLSLDGTSFTDSLLIPANTAHIRAKRERQKLFYLLDISNSVSLINVYLNWWGAIAANF